MRASIESNTRRRWLHRGALLLLAVGALPLVSVAWVAQPRFELHLLEGERGQLEARATRARQLRRRIDERALDARASAYERSAAALRELVPTSVPPFELFHTVRSAARRAGFRLGSAELGTERELGWNHGERELRSTEVHLSGRGTLASWLELVDRVRSAGRPSGVRSLILSPVGSPTADGAEATFDVSAVLETYWSAEAAQDDSELEDPVE